MMLNYKTYFFPRTKFVQILSIYIEHNSSVDFSKTVFARFWFKDRRKWTPCLIYLTKLLRIADSVKIKWKVKVGTQFCHFAKSSPYLWLELHRTKVRWRFRKFLWPSQNIWTLIHETLNPLWHSIILIMILQSLGDNKARLRRFMIRIITHSK